MKFPNGNEPTDVLRNIINFFDSNTCWNRQETNKISHDIKITRIHFPTIE
jgi:hypothetical protein